MKQRNFTRISRPASVFVSRAGVAATELALVSPLLILLALGCVDYGRISHASIALNSAVGAGATYAMSHRFTTSTLADWKAEVLQAATDEMKSVPQYSSGQFTPDVTSTTQGSTTTVTVRATYTFSTLIRWPGLPSPVTITRAVSGPQYR